MKTDSKRRRRSVPVPGKNCSGMSVGRMFCWRRITISMRGSSWRSWKRPARKIDRAVTGRQAVEMFACSEEGEYDVILMDIQMPEMDGWEATRRIRSMEREDAALLPVYAL